MALGQQRLDETPARPVPADRPRRCPLGGRRHRRGRRVTGTVIASAGSVARSGRSRSPCRRGWVVPDRRRSIEGESATRYARMTRQVEALIAGNLCRPAPIPRRVRRALAALFRGAIGKDTVSRVWRKVKTDWEAWSKRPLGEEDVVRLILDGTVVRVRLRQEGDVDLAPRRPRRPPRRPEGTAGGAQHRRRAEAAWRALLDDLVARRAEGARIPDRRRRRRP